MGDKSELDAGDAVPGQGFMLWQIANGWQRAVRAALGPTGLTYVQLMLLAGLRQKIADGGKISQAGLAHALAADVMMTSQVLRTLESAGLIRRDRDPLDTRARTLALTETGAAKLAEALPLFDAVDASFFRVLGDREPRFAKSLRKLWRTHRLDGAPDAAPPKRPKAKRKRPAGKSAPA
jgi:MarR family transcriptional regulator, organic hydroperoxide resistance regulator